MNNELNYIIGAGIVGMITSLFYPSYKIISKDLPLDSFIDSGPKIIKSDIWTDSFVNKLNPLLKKKKYRCAYYYNGQIYSRSDSSFISVIREEYLKKTRGENWNKFLSSGMNNGDFEFEGYDMFEVFSEIWNKIHKRVIYLQVSNICIASKKIYGFTEFDNNIEIDYDKIISTIPLYSFLELVGKKQNLNSNKDIFFYTLENFIHKELFLKNDFSFIYFPGDEFYYRVSYNKEKDIYCLESLYQLDISKLNIGRIIKSKMIKGSKIVSEEKPEDVFYNDGNFKFIGRYAENNNNKRVNDVIKDLSSKEDFDV